MDAHGILYHPSLSGLLTDDMIKVVSTDPQTKESVGEIDIKWGQNTLRPYRIKGQFHMIPLETYDILVFSLLRELFGIGYPSVMVVDYRPIFVGNGEDIKKRPYHNPVALVKKLEDRELIEKDYWPATSENLLFRFRLGVLVVFCKIVGTPFFLNMVRVKNDIPYLWRIKEVGVKNAHSLNRAQFCHLFGFQEQEIFRYYNKQDKSDIPLDAYLVELGVRLQCPGEEKKPQSILFDLVIKYLRSIDFDMDILREFVHLRENPVRGRVSGRGKLKLSRSPAKVISSIEEKYSVLAGPTPIHMFRYH